VVAGAEIASCTLGVNVLARIRYGHNLPAGSDPRDLTVALDPGDSGPRCELWLSPVPVASGVSDGLGYAHNGEVLIGSISYPAVASVDLRTATYDAYRRIYALLREQDYPCPLRVWNYLGGINTGDGDGERYRLFSSGRFDALAAQPGFEGALPAATAVGLAGEGLQIRFLAGRSGGAQVENPRQMSAFRYPRQYGPRSPSFSRATLKAWPDQTHLYVSGTASIVGHETRHIGDVTAQLEETLLNIDALLDEARRQHPVAATIRPALIKLYLRQPADRAFLVSRLRARFGADLPLYGLQADICRRDLLLEIEGIFRFGE
jgi:chorismate lyase/3-hydroxybenzoate synthase